MRQIAWAAKYDVVLLMRRLRMHRGLSLARAMVCFGDDSPVQLVMLRGGVVDEVGKSDQPRCRCRTEIGLGGGEARAVARAT